MSLSYPLFWKNASTHRKRIYLFLLFAVVAALVTVAGTLVPLSLSDSQQIYNRINQTTTLGPTQLAESIFLNNFPLCLAMFIPLFGAVFGLFVMFSTGIALGAELRVESSPGFQGPSTPVISPQTAIFALSLIAAVFVLEYTSYSIGMSESLWLFRRLMQRRWREIKPALKLIGICAVLLTIGAIVETLTIKAGF